MMEQLPLDFGESAEAELAAERQIRAARANAFEAAARSIGMRPGEVGYRLAGLLAVYVDSPSMRALGLTGLRWVGTLAELASDSRLECSIDSVARAIRRFRSAGMIETGQLLDDRGRISGVCIELNMRAIAAAADASCRTAPEVRMLSHESPTRGVADSRSRVNAGVGAGVDSRVGAGVDAVAGAYPGVGTRIDPRKSAPHYAPVLSVESVNPPPTQMQTAAAVEMQDWTAVRDQLRRAGVERVNAAIRIARESGLAPSDVAGILAEYVANSHRIRSPGAILDRIRSGDWPIPIVPPVARAAADEHRRQAASQLAYEHARAAVIAKARREGRWQELTDEDVDREVQALLERGAHEREAQVLTVEELRGEG